MASIASAGTATEAIAAIDLGSAKVVCLIAVQGPGGTLDLAGIGHQRSRGVKSGMVTDLDEAQRALRTAYAQAERMAGVGADRIVLAVACGRIRATRFVARAAIDGPSVRPEDVRRVLSGAESWLERGGRALVETAHVEWCLDGIGGIADPRGLAGRELAADLGAVTADEGPLRNLVATVERNHLPLDRLAAAPVASALAVTSPEERRVGALVVDIGAGVTSLAHFAEGRPVTVEVLPVGGNHVTYDVARGLVTTVAEAERIKTLYGTLVKAASNDSQLVSYPVVGEEEPTLFQVSRTRIGELIRQRIELLLDLVAERLAECGITPGRAGSVVLTGGSSQLVGLEQVWLDRFGGVVRIGRPRPLGRMPAAMCSPAFATVIGLVSAAGSGALEASDRGRLAHGGYIGRVQQWLRESF